MLQWNQTIVVLLESNCFATNRTLSYEIFVINQLFCTKQSLQNNCGILAMLDEECLRPGNTSDGTFLEKLDQLCHSHPHFESRGCKKSQSDKTLPHHAFRLIHYAGSVSVFYLYMAGHKVGLLELLMNNVETLFLHSALFEKLSGLL